MTNKVLKRALEMAVKELNFCPRLPRNMEAHQKDTLCLECRAKSLQPGLKRCYRLIREWFIRKATAELKAKGGRNGRV